jgi:hypothetical protein
MCGRVEDIRILRDNERKKRVMLFHSEENVDDRCREAL